MSKTTVDDPESQLRAVEEKLAAGDHAGAYQSLRGLLAYPAEGLEGDGTTRDAQSSRAIGHLATLTRAFGAPALADQVALVASRPEDPQALFDAAYGLYEERQFEVAATFLARANRLAPGQPAIVAELAGCLEHLHRNGEAALFLDASGTPDREPMCAYLSGFHWIMSGDLEVPRKRVAQLQGVEQGPIPFVREALAGMLARADAVTAAGIALDERALSAWQAVISGSLLLHESPHGHEEPMHGRYAFVSDSPALMREGIERLALLLERDARSPSRVVAAPGRASRLLAMATARRLDLPCLDWAPGAESQGLVVAWTMESVEDVAFMEALRHHAPDQRLFVHASCWTDPFAYSPDVTTLLHQTITHPYTGGALRVDPETRAVVPSEPDRRDDEALVSEILSAGAEDESVTTREQVLALSRAFSGLPEPARPDFLRTSGSRLRQRAGGPVPSARFT